MVKIKQGLSLQLPDSCYACIDDPTWFCRCSCCSPLYWLFPIFELTSLTMPHTSRIILETTDYLLSKLV